MGIRVHVVRDGIVVDERHARAGCDRDVPRRGTARGDGDRRRDAAGTGPRIRRRARRRAIVAVAAGGECREGECERNAADRQSIRPPGAGDATSVCAHQKNFLEILNPIYQSSFDEPPRASWLIVLPRPLEKLNWKTCPPARFSMPNVPWCTPGSWPSRGMNSPTRYTVGRTRMRPPRPSSTVSLSSTSSSGSGLVLFTQIGSK